MPQEQRANQRGNVQAVRIGVSQNAHLVITQLAQVGAAGLDAQRYRNIIHLLRGKNLNGVDLPGIQDLAPERQDRLILAIARLLGRAPRGIAFHEKQLAALRIFARTIRQLAWQRRARRNFLAHHFLGRSETALGALDTELSEPLRVRGVLIQPQAKSILRNARDKPGRLTGREPFLGLTRELWVLQLR